MREIRNGGREVSFVPGAPQVLRHTVMPEIIVEKGETAHLSMVVCADPRPRTVSWEWGSLRLEEGKEMGKHMERRFLFLLHRISHIAMCCSHIALN